MSEVTSVKQEQQQKQFVGGSSNTELRCKNCNISFNSDKSLEVHVQYHKENLLSQWTNQVQQQESNNNNSKTGNHNRHVSIKQECVAAPTDSNESSSTPSSQDSSQQQPQQSQQTQQQQQQQQQQPQQPVSSQAYNNYLAPISFSNVTNLQNMSHVQNIPIGTCQSFSPSQDDLQNNGGGNASSSNVSAGYARYHPYQPQHFSSEHANANSTSPQSPPFQCENCGAVYEDANQLGEHMRTNHSDSPTAYPAAPQYQQLSSSPQHPDQQQQSLHTSPSHSSQSQQPTANYDYNGGQAGKLDTRQEPEEQTEILDLDSHKVQTHRYQEELMRLHQQQRQQELQMHMHQHQHQVMQHQQHRLATHSMLGWPTGQPHDYHAGLQAMGPMESIPSIVDQGQFMRGQHMSVETPVHQGSPIITNTQTMPSHQMQAGLPLQQPLKPPSNQAWKSNEPRRPKTYNCTACNKWFTSSGHLKRHYNTTLHKNAVKQSNQPDPANMPISAHHHPTRENNVGHSTGSRGGGGAPERSPDFASSGSPPNVMAGPSGEATGGLHHTPIPPYNSNSNSSHSSNSSDSLAVAALAQQQQQQQQQQQGPPSAVHLGSGMAPHTSPQQSLMAGHHQQQMGSPSHQMGLQQQQQQQQQQQPLHHLPMSSPGQHQLHHSMSSPISPMHPPPASHMSSPSPMDSSTHLHHMNSSSTITSGTVHPVMVSPTAMGGTSMPHQPYPNAMPPHVTTITNLLESTIHQTTIGNDQTQHDQQQQQQQAQDMLPGFGTFNQHQGPLPSFRQLVVPGFLEPNRPQAINVGGLSSEEASQERCFNSPVSSYDLYTNSSPRYGTLVDMDVAMALHANEDNMVIKHYDVQNQPFQSHQFQQSREYPETNNNNNNNNNDSTAAEIKETVNSTSEPKARPSKGRKGRASSAVLKEQQVTSVEGAVEADTTSDETNNERIECVECKKKFNKVCYLTQHKKSFHAGNKPYKCTLCGKRFLEEALYNSHLQKHAGDKPHKCDTCPKQFNHKTDLRRHRCLHTGEKPYSCNTCGKGFIRKDHMVKHHETHKRKSNNHRHQKENVRERIVSYS